MCVAVAARNCVASSNVRGSSITMECGLPEREAVFEWDDGERRMKVEPRGLKRTEVVERESISARRSKAENPMSKASAKEGSDLSKEAVAIALQRVEEQGKALVLRAVLRQLFKYDQAMGIERRQRGKRRAKAEIVSAAVLSGLCEL